MTYKWLYALTAEAKEAIILDEENQINELPPYSMNLIHLQKQYFVRDKMSFFAGINEVFYTRLTAEDIVQMIIYT